MKKPKRVAEPQIQVDSFNAQVPVGTFVRYWRGTREDPPSGVGKIRRAASVMGGHTAVAWIEGCSGAVSLSHVEVIGEVAMEQVVIYERPKDYPQGYVARIWYVVKGLGEPIAGRVLGAGPDLAALRELAVERRGLTRIPRDPKDDPAVLEVWI